MTRLYHQLCCTCSIRPPSDHLHFNMMRLLRALFGVSCYHISSETNGTVGRHVGVHEPPLFLSVPLLCINFSKPSTKTFFILVILFIFVILFIASYRHPTCTTSTEKNQCIQFYYNIVHYKKTKWSYVEQSKVERSKVEQNGAKYNRTEQSKTERSKAKPNGAK